MFKATKEVIEAKIDKIRHDIKEVGLQLRDLGKDGDLFDEPLMHQLHIQREQLDRELAVLKGHLINSGDILREDSFIQMDRVEIGHEVEVEITYSDQSTESLSVTTGTHLDQRFLADSEYFDGDTKVIISDSSPLGQSIIGNKAGEEVKYRVGDSHNSVRINKISPSHHLEK